MPFPLPPQPAEVYGELFHDVQRAAIFADQKTFVDCVPKVAPVVIMEHYAAARLDGRVPDLRAFVEEHFLVPEFKPLVAPFAERLVDHLTNVWSMLERAPDVAVEGSSLLPLAHAYLIPGGRFREVCYWDSYFMMLGLRESGREDLIRSMTNNFADLAQRYGLIPNGNRSYYLTRSQPPVLALMVDLIAEQDGPAAYRNYLPALQAELDYWNDRGPPTQHNVDLPDGRRLQRYHDQGDYPRPEAQALDEDIGLGVQRDRAGLYRDIRSAAESGWDFSSRWFADGSSMAATRTTEFLPVDLNCFLHRLERALATAWAAAGSAALAVGFEQAAAHRAETIQQFCWSEDDGFFFDYHWPSGRRSPHLTLAGVAPLFLRVATPSQADAVAAKLRDSFLRPGGLVSTLVASGEQWDAPNGWAPLQWMAIAGLAAYGHHDLAAEIAGRWVRLNSTVFARTGRFMEKYNVVDLSLPAGGGEYPTQDGFGWTNGVLQKLLRTYPQTG